MRNDFELALAEILRAEGGYSNDPRDPGGPTNMGVTLATARRNRLDKDGDGDVDAADVKRLTRDDAAKIYRREYWDDVGADSLPAGVDLIAFDAAVNQGQGNARTWLRATAGLAPLARIDALAALRLKHYQGRPKWPVYGRGWTNRLDAIAKLARLWASRGSE